MKNLEKIVIEQIRIELGRLTDSYRQEIEAMKRLHAAKGILKSGATIKATIEASKKLHLQFRDCCCSKIKTIVDESIILPEASITELKNSILTTSHTIRGTVYAIMADSTKLAGKPELCDRYMPEIEKEREQVLEEINLFIDSGVIIKRNRGLKGLVKTISGLVSKVFGSPAS